MSKVAACVWGLVVCLGCVMPPTTEEIRQGDRGPRPVAYADSIRGYFNHVLPNPSAVHYEFEAPVESWYTRVDQGRTWPTWTVYAWRVSVTVNAKNPQGKYAGWAAYDFYFYGEKIQFVDGPR